MAGRRPTQAERSALTRSALLESASQGLSRHGYGNLVLEQVAREADTRAAPSTTSSGTRRTWRWRCSSGSRRPGEQEVGEVAEHQPDAATALIALARGHAVYCRRDVARVMMALELGSAGTTARSGGR